MPRKAAGGPRLQRQVRGVPWPALQPSEPTSSPHGGEAQSEKGHPPKGLERAMWQQVTYQDVAMAQASEGCSWSKAVCEQSAGP